MCKLNNIPVTVTRFTGYKIVTKDKYGRLYSPYTGMKYQKGSVKEVKVCGQHTAWNHNVLSANYYTLDCVGRTAVFTSIEEATEEAKSISRMGIFNEQFNTDKFYIAEMTVSNELRHGTYAMYDIISGKYIESVKLIKSK